MGKKYKNLKKKNVVKKRFKNFLANDTPGHPLVSTKKFRPFGPAVWPTYKERIYECLVLLYRIIAEEPWRKKFLLKKCVSTKKMSVQSVQPFGRLYATYIYTNVLLYYIDKSKLDN